jgi:hypothetical protein
MLNSNDIYINSIFDEIISSFKQHTCWSQEFILKISELNEQMLRDKFYIKSNLPYIRNEYTLLEWTHTNKILLYVGVSQTKENTNNIMDLTLVFYDQSDCSFYKMPFNQYVMDYTYDAIKIHTLLKNNKIKELFNKYQQFKSKQLFL